jgi:hypothetical protein
MATIEIDEAEFLRGKKAREFVETLWANPKARRRMLEAQREVKPDDPMVKELERPDPVEERFAALAKKLDDQEKAMADDKATREQAEKLSAFKKQRDDGFDALRREGWTDKGLEGVEELMTKKGILDPLDAAAIWEKANPPQNPLTPRSGAWNFLEPTGGGDEDLKKLIDSRGESNPLLDKIIHDAISDVRRR